MGKERLIAFTDALLAIIMTILVLELEKPAQPSPAAFWALRTNYFSYALSFFWLGSLWVSMNSIWENVRKINMTVVWWNLLLLFLASLIPYATSLCSDYFYSKTMQGFYGIVVIAMTVCNYMLHKALKKADPDNEALSKMIGAYLKTLLPDIAIKCAGFVLAVTVYPPVMMYSVLAAAAFILISRHAARGKA